MESRGQCLGVYKADDSTGDWGPSTGSGKHTFHVSGLLVTSWAVGGAGAGLRENEESSFDCVEFMLPVRCLRGVILPFFKSSVKAVWRSSLALRVCWKYTWREEPQGPGLPGQACGIHKCLAEMALFRMHSKFDWLLCSSFTWDLRVLPKRMWFSWFVFIQFGTVHGMRPCHAPCPQVWLACFASRLRSVAFG